MTVASEILRLELSHRIRINSRTGILLTLLTIIATIFIALRSQSEQHCVASGAFTVMNKADGEIIQQPDTQPAVRCFTTLAEAANYGSGGALNLPLNASEEEVTRALRERTIP